MCILPLKLLGPWLLFSCLPIAFGGTSCLSHNCEISPAISDSGLFLYNKKLCKKKNAFLTNLPKIWLYLKIPYLQVPMDNPTLSHNDCMLFCSGVILMLIGEKPIDLKGRGLRPFHLVGYRCCSCIDDCICVAQYSSSH